jgi:hypothetical protein
MVVTPHEITAHSAIRPRIVMLWVFFLVTVVVVGPTVPASAFVSCTWHHSQLPGEHPETINDDGETSPTGALRVTRTRSPRESWRTAAALKRVPLTALATSPEGTFPSGITLRGPPASH